MFEGLFGAEVPLAIRLCLAFLVALGSISATAWALTRFGRRRLAVASGQQARLSIIDTASIEGSRRLILIRRDNVEHLLMIGGPTDVVVETNILRPAGAPLKLPLTHSSAAAERQPRPILERDKASRPLPPEPMATPHPALQPKPPAPPFKPLSQDPAAGQRQAQAEPSTRLQRDTLAALANELSTRPPAPRKSSATVVRPQPIEPRPELGSEPGPEFGSETRPELWSEPAPESRPEHRVEPQPELPMEPPQPAQPAVAETASPESAEIASTADEELAEFARLLEAKLRKPNVPTNARPYAAPARVAPPPQRAPAAEAIPEPPSPQRAPAAEAGSAPPPLRVRSPSEPKSPRVDAKQSTAPSDSLEQQLANLLGRPTKN